MRKSSGNYVGSAPRPSSDESGASLPMPADVKEAVIDLLAQILVADYELFQGVTGPMVKISPVFNRRLKLVQPGEKAG